MYVTFGSFIIGFLVLLAFGMLSGLALASSFLRRYLILKAEDQKIYARQLQAKETRLKEATHALQQIISRVYHKGIIPKTATIRGLCGLMLTKFKSMIANLELARRPNHFRYVDLAIKSTEDFERCTNAVNDQAEELHQYTRDSVKEFEHLQEHD